MFDDLRELVEAERKRQIPRIRVNARMGRITIREGQEQVDAVNDEADALLAFIEETENPTP